MSAETKNNPEPSKSRFDSFTDTIKEGATKLSDSIKDSMKNKVDEMQATVDSSKRQELITKKINEYVSFITKSPINGDSPNRPDITQLAGDVATTAKENKDASLITSYVDAVIHEKYASNGRGIALEDQSAIADAADQLAGGFLEGSNYNQFDESAYMYRLIGELPEAQKQYVERAMKAIANGTFENFDMPPYVASLPQEIQQKIYEQKPGRFALLFPASSLVKGPALTTAINEAKGHISGKTAMDLPNTFIGRSDGNNIIQNPNLSPKQLDELANSLIEMGYDKDPKRNEDFMQATENVAKVLRYFRWNRTLPESTKSKLKIRFPAPCDSAGI